jgi:hypothetical protein
MVARRDKPTSRGRTSARRPSASRRIGAPKEFVIPERKPGQELWEWIVELGNSFPADVRARFPTDGARNLDHYLYGAPKQDD